MSGPPSTRVKASMDPAERTSWYAGQTAPHDLPGVDDLARRRSSFARSFE